MKRIPFLIAALLAVGCSAREPKPASPTTSPTVGSRVTWCGIAENRKVGAFLSGPGIYVDLPDTHWPWKVVGTSVEVTGTVVERHDLPVFIDDPNRPTPSGIPVPPGTDLHEASRRLILEQVEWRSARNGG